MRTMFPPAAIDWLTPDCTGETLAIGAAGGPVIGRRLADGRPLCMVSHDQAALAARRSRTPGLRAVMATAGSLPFATCTFAEAVVAGGPNALAGGVDLSEVARVLVPDGRLVMYLITRDDSVPWVRRLAAIMRRADPAAMTSAAPDDPLAGNRLFPQVEKREFRMWVPMTKEKLLDQAAHNDTIARLDPAQTATIVADIGKLYDELARVPEPLLLPYTVVCWRATVKHQAPGLSGFSRDDSFHIFW